MRKAVPVFTLLVLATSLGWLTLSDGMVSGYRICGTERQQDPLESISSNDGKICIYESSSGNKLCYDAMTNSTH